MKIAIVGSSSVGKTTLAKAIVSAEEALNLSYLNADARRLIANLGYKNIDDIPQSQRQLFQLKYLDEKIQLEENMDNYISDRSYVDIAAYWVIRDAIDEPESRKETMVERCKILAQHYDLHIFLPFGIIPFEYDGYRSKNIKQDQQISNQILCFLEKWKLDYIIINEIDFSKRLKIAVDKIREL